MPISNYFIMKRVLEFVRAETRTLFVRESKSFGTILFCDQIFELRFNQEFANVKFQKESYELKLNSNIVLEEN